DVKQSVYRFRHAEPNLFIEKYNRFNKEEDNGKRIDLARNFRSREEVLDSANYIFRQLLDEQLGEIAYDQAAELIYGNRGYDEFPLQEPETELVLIDRDKDNEPEQEQAPDDGTAESFQDLEKAHLEARAYAQKIKQWIGQEGNKEQI